MKWIAAALVVLALAIAGSALGVALILDDDRPQHPGCVDHDQSTPCPRIVDQ